MSTDKAIDASVAAPHKIHDPLGLEQDLMELVEQYPFLGMFSASGERSLYGSSVGFM